MKPINTKKKEILQKMWENEKRTVCHRAPYAKVEKQKNVSFFLLFIANQGAPKIALP